VVCDLNCSELLERLERLERADPSSDLVEYLYTPADVISLTTTLLLKRSCNASILLLLTLLSIDRTGQRIYTIKEIINYTADYKKYDRKKINSNNQCSE
jgi:hypothetical protein